MVPFICAALCRSPNNLTFMIKSWISPYMIYHIPYYIYIYPWVHQNLVSRGCWVGSTTTTTARPALAQTRPSGSAATEGPQEGPAAVGEAQVVSGTGMAAVYWWKSLGKTWEKSTIQHMIVIWLWYDMIWYDMIWYDMITFIYIYIYA